MPTEVAVNVRESFAADQQQQSLTTETKSGSITLVASNGRRQGVNVIVYRTSLEHFAVLYPQKKICRPLGVVNLRSTTVERVENRGLRVRQLGYDHPMTLTFLCEPGDLEGWFAAFTSRCQPPLRHQSSLPIVEEGEEPH